MNVEKGFVCKAIVEGEPNYYGTCMVEGDVLEDLLGAVTFSTEEAAKAIANSKTGAYDPILDKDYDTLDWEVKEIEIKEI